jgi:hypothetical protein
MTYIDDFRDLLRRVAAGDEPVDAIESWFTAHEEELKSDGELALKGAVQEALARTWSWRNHHATDAELRAALASLAARLASG